jgi:serine/threonine protein kinase
MLKSIILSHRGYIAPEQIDNGELSFKADIYSLGIIIMRLLIGGTEPLNLQNVRNCFHLRMMPFQFSLDFTLYNHE